MRECKFDNCNQCVHSNNADCDNPKFEKHMEEEKRKKVAVGNTYQDGLEVGLSQAYKEIVEEIEERTSMLSLAIQNPGVEMGISILNELKEKFDKTETDNGNAG